MSKPKPRLYAAEKKDLQREFLGRYRRHGVIRRAAAEVGLSVESHYAWIARDKEYRREFEQAKVAAAENVEKARRRRIRAYHRDRKKTAKTLLTEALQRVLFGVPKPLWYKGKPVIDPETESQAVEFQKGDHLLTRMLEAYMPEEFRNSLQVVQQTGITVQQIAGDVAGMAAMIPPPAEAVQAALRAQIIRQLEGPGGSDGNGNGNGNGSGNGHVKPEKESP